MVQDTLADDQALPYQVCLQMVEWFRSSIPDKPSCMDRWAQWFQSPCLPPMVRDTPADYQAPTCTVWLQLVEWFRSSFLDKPRCTDRWTLWFQSPPPLQKNAVTHWLPGEVGRSSVPWSSTCHQGIGGHHYVQGISWWRQRKEVDGSTVATACRHHRQRILCANLRRLRSGDILPLATRGQSRGWRVAAGWWLGAAASIQSQVHCGRGKNGTRRSTQGTGMPLYGGNSALGAQKKKKKVFECMNILTS